MRRDLLIAGGISGVIALLVLSTRKRPTPATGLALLRAAPHPGLLLALPPAVLTPGTIRPAPRPGLVLTLPPPPPASAQVRYLTGEQLPGDPILASTIAEVAARLEPLRAYYTNVWYPEHVGSARPDVPRTLSLISHYRSFDDQARIVAGQFGPSRPRTDEEIRAVLLQSLTTRSIPGFSRHHWGTDVDLVSAESANFAPGGRLAVLIPFFRDVAPRFGFYNTYAAGQYPAPSAPHYNPEPWHTSYFSMAAPLQNQWLEKMSSDELARLLDRAAYAIGQKAGVSIPALRRVLGTLDLPSYVRNVAPAPQVTV